MPSVTSEKHDSNLGLDIRDLEEDKLLGLGPKKSHPTEGIFEEGGWVHVRDK